MKVKIKKEPKAEPKPKKKRVFRSLCTQRLAVYEYTLADGAHCALAENGITYEESPSSGASGFSFFHFQFGWPNFYFHVVKLAETRHESKRREKSEVFPIRRVRLADACDCVRPHAHERTSERKNAKRKKNVNFYVGFVWKIKTRRRSPRAHTRRRFPRLHCVRTGGGVGVCAAHVSMQPLAVASEHQRAFDPRLLSVRSRWKCLLVAFICDSASESSGEWISTEK